MVGFHSPDLFDLNLCNRLLIRDDGQSLQQNISKHLLFRLLCDSNQIVISLRFRTHLIRSLQLYDIDAPVFCPISFLHGGNRLTDTLLRFFQCPGKPAKLHASAHSKEYRLNDPL